MDKGTIIAVGGCTLLLILLSIAILRKINMASKEIWDVHPEVYHYTNFSTALLIIESANLRATNIGSLNDTQEIIYAKKIIAAKLLEMHEGATSDDDVKRVVVDNFFEAMGINFFITSFCGKDSSLDPTHHTNGLLSMWRSYGGDGGCAIIFRTKNIYDQTIDFINSLDTPTAFVMDTAIYKGSNDNDPNYIESLQRFAKNLNKYKEKPPAIGDPIWKELCDD